MRHARTGKKLGPRYGDAADMVYLELVDYDATAAR